MVERGGSGSEIAADLNNRGYRRRNGKAHHQVLAIAWRPDLYRQGKLRYGSVTATNEKLDLIAL